jgi:hypothetical protein
MCALAAASKIVVAGPRLGPPLVIGGPPPPVLGPPPFVCAGPPVAVFNKGPIVSGPAIFSVAGLASVTLKKPTDATEPIARPAQATVTKASISLADISR